MSRVFWVKSEVGLSLTSGSQGHWQPQVALSVTVLGPLPPGLKVSLFTGVFPGLVTSLGSESSARLGSGRQSDGVG